MDRLTTLRSTTAANDQVPHRSRIGRLARRLGVGLAVTTAAVAMLGPGSASASAAVVPQYTFANCGYVIQQVALNSPFYWKISRTNFPYVTGTSTTPQRVWLLVQFVHNQNQVYRQGWFYTDAVAGRWSTTWTFQPTGATGKTWTEDAGGESGYIGGEFTSLDTFVLLSMQWMSGATTMYQASEWAYAPNSSQNHNVCNAGADMH